MIDPKQVVEAWIQSVTPEERSAVLRLVEDALAALERLSPEEREEEGRRLVEYLRANEPKEVADAADALGVPADDPRRDL